jgi:hypothetical protein
LAAPRAAGFDLIHFTPLQSVGPLSPFARSMSDIPSLKQAVMMISSFTRACGVGATGTGIQLVRPLSHQPPLSFIRRMNFHGFRTVPNRMSLHPPRMSFPIHFG